MSVTIVIGKRHLVAGLSLLVLTALLGVALVIPAVSDATTTYTRSASCSGLDFEPDSGSASFMELGITRYSVDGSTDYFRCNASLPNGAIVTKVQFTAEYSFGAGDPTRCSLDRVGISATTSFAYLADVTFSDTGAGVVQRLSDATITDPTINNGSYAYYLECALDEDNAGVIGGDVIYKVSAANA